MKDQKGTTIDNAFQKVFDESKRKPNKIWLDKGGKFYNKSMKSGLKDNDIGISDLKDQQKIVGYFYEKELQKTSQKEFKIEKLIERKGDKLYVKWKGYDNSFDSWIDKKNIA